MEYGPQLSRNFKAFKIWCSLQVFGIKAFREAVEHVLDLAVYMGQRIQADDLWELLAPVKLNAACFRLKAGSDAKNQALLAKLIEDGTALLGPVHIRGEFGLRACITNFRTERSDIDLVLERLKQLSALLTDL